jgi:hypothetical protein
VSSTTSTLQINLLPDARLAKQRSIERRRAVGLLATTISGVMIGLVVIAYAVTLAQDHRISNQSKQISDLSNQLLSKPDLNNVVTLQQHITDLGPLYKQRIYLTNFFATMQNVATTDISVNNLTYQTTSGNLAITGHAKSFAAVDKYVKILEAGIKDAKAQDGAPYFSNIVISGLSKDGTTTNFSLTVQVNSEALHG